MDGLYFDSDSGVVLGIVINWVGVVIFLVLIVGVVMWGYLFLLCDVFGVLVVCVLDGLMCE